MGTASDRAPAAGQTLRGAADELSERDARIVALGREGRSALSIAREEIAGRRWSDSLVRKVLHANGVQLREAACSPRRRALSAERRTRAVELWLAYDGEISAAEIGTRIGVGESQALNLLHAGGIETPPKPPPESGRLAANEATREAVRERDRYASERGLLTTQDLEEQMVLRRESIVYLRRGEGPQLAPVEWLEVKGFRFPLYGPQDVKAHQRRRHLSGDHRVRMHRNPESERRRARTLGYSKTKADELAARAEARADREKRVRKGLRPAEGRHARWRALFTELQGEHNDATTRELYGLVALIDWQTHPEDWPRTRYPANRDGDDFADKHVRNAAADRIRKAIAG
jgi:hypothetical protein